MTYLSRAQKPYEYETCVAFWEWCHYVKFNGMPLNKYMFHIPNERKCKPATAIALKKMGLTPGVYDYFVMIPTDDDHGLFLEFKRDEKCSLTDSQVVWGSNLTKFKYGRAVAKSFEQGKDIIRQRIVDGEKYLSD